MKGVKRDEERAHTYTSKTNTPRPQPPAMGSCTQRIGVDAVIQQGQMEKNYLDNTVDE